MPGAGQVAYRVSGPASGCARGRRRRAGSRRLPLSPVSAADFAARLDRLGPFEPAPHLAVAVSGGADSLSLAVLAQEWAADRGAKVTGLIVDHGLRAVSAAEAAHVADQIAGLGIAPRVLRLDGLARGAGLAERARRGRYAALAGECAASGILHLLVGHHLADQAETVTMRREAGSGPAGLAGMAALVETEVMRILRPLLGIPPARLRDTLRERALDWVEDPSNADLTSRRARVRASFADPGGTGPAVAAHGDAAVRHGGERATAEWAAANWMGRHAEIRPEGYVLVDAGPWDRLATGALLRMVGGREHPPPSEAVARLAAAPVPATLGGVRIMPAGRWRPGGWLLVREAAAMAAPLPPGRGGNWDNRFRLCGNVPRGTTFGAPRVPPAGFRGRFPAAVARTIPVLERIEKVDTELHVSTAAGIVFAPPVPAACALFAPMQPGC